MDAAGVTGAVIHPPSWDSTSNELSVAAAEAHPDRFAILGRIPLDEPESRGEIETWLDRPGMVGLRYTFLRPHMASWPHDGTMDWLWPAAERLGIPIALLAGDFLPLVGQIAERHPRLKLIVDHFGVGRLHVDEAAFVTPPEVGRGAASDIAVKVTGPQYVSDGYPFKSLTPRYKAIYDAPGPRRMFWGTDITRMPCTWRECVTAFTEHQAGTVGRHAADHGSGHRRLIGWKRLEDQTAGDNGDGVPRRRSEDCAACARYCRAERRPSSVVTLPPAARSTASPAAVSHSMVGPRRG